jgi:hypothetical protein
MHSQRVPCRSIGSSLRTSIWTSPLDRVCQMGARRSADGLFQVGWLDTGCLASAFNLLLRIASMSVQSPEQGMSETAVVSRLVMLHCV